MLISVNLMFNEFMSSFEQYKCNSLTIKQLISYSFIFRNYTPTSLSRSLLGPLYSNVSILQNTQML